MTNSVDTTIKLMNVGSTCKELEAICIGYEDNNKELFDYYNDMKKWLFSQYKFIHSEAEINYKLDKENLEKERIEVEKEQIERKKEIERIISEIEKNKSEVPVPVKEQTTYTPKTKKMPIERQIEFKIFGYKIYSFIEIEKM